MTTDDLFEAFQNPGPEWRGKPFWAWNGRLDKAELLRQVHVMKEMGLGGFFMHSRVGLATEYLGDDWFECINACADEAEKLGMEAWLYDEDRWPSGSAGGLVTANPDFRMRYLRCTVLTPGSPELATLAREGEIARFACTLADDGLSYAEQRRLAEGESASPGEATLVFSVEEMAKSNFYNGYTYLDTMSRAATDAFLQSTHEKYVERCGDRLGKSIKGIFTDEPHRGSLMTSFGQGLGSSEWIVPWTPKMPEHWHAAHGDDLLDHLPEIFLFPDGQSVHPTKWRYVELCLTLFIENFCKPMDAWCCEHNLILTGHFLHEDNLTAQVAMNGSMLRCYAHMEYPGMDLLTEGNKAFWVAKQLQSVGRQLGKPWLMSELYGCTGWQMGLEGHKHVGDWQALFGVNLRCHHLSWYTMEGEAKRDYPASILHQSAWWKDYSAVETYFARLGLLLSQGEPFCDVLVIHPVESVWAQIHPGWCNGLGPKAPAIQKLETQFAELFHWLQGAQIDFDYGDEGILAEHARVCGTDFPYMEVGEMLYKKIVVGGCINLRSSTMALLEQFAEKVHWNLIFLGEPPVFVDGLPSDRPCLLAERCIKLAWSQEALVEMGIRDPDFPILMPHQIRIKPHSPDVFVQARVLQTPKNGGDGHHMDTAYVLHNTNREHEAKGLEVDFVTYGDKVEEWNPLTGEHVSIQPSVPSSDYPLPGYRLDLAPGETRVFVCRMLANEVATPHQATDPGVPVELTGPFAYLLDEPNALVLDTAMWELTSANPLTPARRGDNAVVPPLVPTKEETEREGVRGSAEILKIDQAVRRHFGLEVRGGEMVQPWYAEKFHGEPPVLGTLTLRFAFMVEVLPEGPLYLAMERPERFVVTVNGSPLTPARRGDNREKPQFSPVGRGAGGRFWIDACFTLLDVPEGALQMGENTITLTTEFRRDSDLEAIYLLGDFGVRLDGPKRTVVTLPETLAVGDICEQGLPFYTGCVTYHVGLPPGPRAAGESVLELPEVGGACVRINGQTIPWPPYTTSLTPFAPTKEENGEGGGERCEPGDAGDAGDAEIAVTVVLTRRNLFGPLHLVPKQQVAYGPGHWTTEGTHWSDHYQLYPSGLLAPPRYLS